MDEKLKRVAHAVSDMGLMSKILGESGSSRNTEDYVELNANEFEMTGTELERQVRIARISDKQDVIDIKDAVYDGDVVVADITRHSTQDRTMEHISDELKQVANEVGGDIVQKDDDQLIITPAGVGISRERLGQ
ncbi:hypothetical protein HISP_13115 [Haloarcula hispanica N601]|uniref:DUF552 domain-containing protein n=3 Tax=Haloarcula hispanica TaxID=51589 RepID=V5TP85_HALHI|nr:hypothetical protein HISP_13115 [Haloarcula hispanica N601]